MTSLRWEAKPLLKALLTQAIESAEADARPLGPRVHELRTSLKKARALLRLVDPLLGRAGRKERRGLAAISRSVAPVRDAAVAIETFDRLAGASRIGARLGSALRARFVVRRRNLEDGARLSKELRRAARALRASRRRGKGLLRRGAGHRALVDGFVLGYRRARRAMKEAYRRNTPEAFHAWRKAVKAHAFHVEALARAGMSTIEGRRGPLDALGATLGEAHDLGSLAAAIRVEVPHLANGRAYERMLALARTRQRDIHIDVRPLGRRLFATRPRTVRKEIAASLK
jgi:CHAD domain-containing protein